MTDPVSPTPPSDAPLQFERAEYSQPAAAQCTACKRGITDTYFEVNGHLLCPSCREMVEASLTGGSKSGRFFRALAFGSGAAVAGAALYYGVSTLTGYNLGLIAVAVGWMVGVAVRKGSDGRGGRFYQVLAVLLTYLSVCASLAPDVYKGFVAAADDEAPVADGAAKPGTEAAAPPPTAEAPAAAAGAPSAADEAPAAAATAEPAAAAKPTAEAPTNAAAKPTAASADDEEPSGEDSGLRDSPFIVQLVVVALVSLAAPFLLGFESPISLLIYGFALWEAWRRNRRAELKIEGPFQLAPAAAESPSPAAAQESSVG